MKKMAMTETSQITTADRFRQDVDAGSLSAAFANYIWMRERVFAMIDEWHSAEDTPSEYWREELQGFEYMFDASPLIVNRLREHCYHLTGLRPYEYRAHHAHQAGAFRAKLGALRTLDPVGLFVPESPLLGGFGFNINGALVNTDTLKFYESLLALRLAGVLDSFRKPAGERLTVLEIGAGWGGFAYQFKTLCPHVSYVIVDLPQSLLFSGVYLKTVFPNARVWVYGERPGSPLPADYHTFDFILLPHCALSSLGACRIDMGINMVSFQEMTSQQVDEYAGWLSNLGCPVFYSHNRERSKHNRELTGVSSILARYYQLQEIDVLGVPYTDLNASVHAAGRDMHRPVPRTFWTLFSRHNSCGKMAAANALDYRHFVGRLRQQ